MRYSVTRVWLWTLTWLVCVGAIAADDAPLRFGVFPRWNAQIMVAEFTPLAEVLGRAVGRRVRIETDKDFTSFMRRVYAREFDLLHVNQLQYLQAHDRAGYRVLAKLCESADCTIRAVIVTRSNSGLHRVADLRGKTVAFGGRNAMVSHLLAAQLLRRHGLEPGAYRSVFAKNPPNALLTVYNGAADAAGVGSPVFERPEIRRRVDAEALRILAVDDPVPPLPIAVRADLEPALTRRLRQTLIDLAADADGRAMLARMGASHFAGAAHEEYAALNQLVEPGRHVEP